MASRALEVHSDKLHFHILSYQLEDEFKGLSGFKGVFGLEFR